MTHPPTLHQLGWQPYFANQVSETETRIPVRITAVYTKGVSVMGDDGLELTLQQRPAGSTVGDWLLIHPHQPNYKAKRLERSSLIQRKAPGSGRKIQYMAANLDTTFIVSSCNKEFNVARIERYIALALEARITPVIVLTKSDLAGDELELYQDDAMEILDEVAVVVVDARNQTDVTTKLDQWCQAGQTVAFFGSSGVGKSTLVNSLCGETVAETRQVRDDDVKGRHTTSHRQIHFSSQGCAILDTPGMRELQLMDVATGVAHLFADIVELSTQCRFSDCQHDTEPGCAILAAIDNGDLDPMRVGRWEKLSAEDEENSGQMLARKSLPKESVKATM